MPMSFFLSTAKPYWLRHHKFTRITLENNDFYGCIIDDFLDEKRFLKEYFSSSKRS